jgi:subtilase family serine protease
MKKTAKVAFAAALVAGPVAGLSAAGPASAAPAGFSAGHAVQLTWDRVPGISGAQLLGPAPANTAMQVVVALQDPGVQAEKAYVASEYTKGSPNFHQFLTPSEIGQRFGPALAQTDDVVDRLKAAGLTIESVAATRDYVSAVGSPAQVGKAFATTEDLYRAADGREFIANVEGPTVMSGDGIGTVVGLNTWQQWNLPSMPKTQQAYQEAEALAARAKAAGTGISLTTTPQDLWNIYNQPAAISGQGQQVAVIGEGDPTAPIANLRGFEKQFGLPAVPVKVNCVDKDTSGTNDCGTDTSGNGEWNIDFTASTGMAPNVSALQLYFSQNLADPDLDNAFEGWVQDPNAPRQASASEGVCEETPLNGIWRGPLESLNSNDNESVAPGLAFGDDQEPVIETELLAATAQGKTLFASTGDTGFTCGAVILPDVGAGNGVIYNGPPSVDYPAASAYSVAVGGTVLYTDGGSPANKVAEYAWNFSGGGPSQFIAAPPWETDNTHNPARCLSDPSGGTGATGLPCRGLPDVVAQSGDITGDGYDIGPGGVGAGTSLAAPLWQGMWARIQSSDVNPSGYGFAAPTLNALGEGATASSDFNDITIGDNGYPALPGWDYASGFGSPNVANLITDTRAYVGSNSGAGGDVPESPAAVLIPVLALAVAGGLLYRRRRRVTDHGLGLQK